MHHVEQRESSAFEVETGTRNAQQDASISRRTLQRIQLSPLGMESAEQFGARRCNFCNAGGLRVAQNSMKNRWKTPHVVCMLGHADLFAHAATRMRVSPNR